MRNGVLKQAMMWAEGLGALGHEVHFIGPNQDGSIYALKEFDVVHFFLAWSLVKGLFERSASWATLVFFSDFRFNCIAHTLRRLFDTENKQIQCLYHSFQL